jgi:excisionase family DNA binding protein
MTGPAQSPTVFYTAAEVAALLRCSEWWVKEQARRRRIPYARIGGSYLFTAEHIAETVRRFEVQPVDESVPVNVVRLPARGLGGEGDQVSPVLLRARPPRRARAGAASDSSAA